MVFTAFFPTLRAGGRGAAEQVSNATRRGVNANARTVSKEAAQTVPEHTATALKPTPPLIKALEKCDCLVLDVSAIKCIAKQEASF